MQHRAGFTLIELSIVLVIIGLIIGGVLVGRTLIEAAAVRAQIAQIEQFKTAVNSFRTKYNGLPGDLNYTDAGAFGFTPRSGQPGDGDGNGILESCAPQSVVPAIGSFGCETALFWRDLSDAGLIAGNFTGDTDGFITMLDGQQDQFIPAAKIGSQNFIAVYGGTATYSFSGANLSGDAVTYALVQGITSSSFSENITNLFTGITPAQAFAIDTKMDDGMPATGLVMSGMSVGLLMPINFLVFPSNCTYSNDGGNTYYYQLSAATVDQPSCIMNFQ